MNRDRARILAPVMLAFANGKAVQYRQPNETEWRNSSDPGFAGGYLWRVKPEPREFWIYVGNMTNVLNKILPVDGPSPGADYIKVREIIDG